MFDIGFWEILLILVLALVVIGPERLPGAARKAGYFIGKARRYIEGVRSEVESELDVSEFKRMLHNQEVQINELKQKLQEGADDVGKELPKTDILTDVPTHSFYDTEEKSDTEDKSSSSAAATEASSADASAGPEDEKDGDQGEDKPAGGRAG